MNTYRKELRTTVGFGVVYVLLGHTGMFAILTGVDNSIRVLGLPLHYFIAITLGTLGVFVVSVIWCISANRMEDDIDAENARYLQGIKSQTLAETKPDAAPSFQETKLTEAGL